MASPDEYEKYAKDRTREIEVEMTEIISREIKYCTTPHNTGLFIMATAIDRYGWLTTERTMLARILDQLSRNKPERPDDV